MVDWTLLMKYLKWIKSKLPVSGTSLQHFRRSVNVKSNHLNHLKTWSIFLFPIMTETIVTVPKKRFGSISFLISFLFGTWMWLLELNNMTPYACGGVSILWEKNTDIGFFNVIANYLHQVFRMGVSRLFITKRLYGFMFDTTRGKFNSQD